MRWMGLDVHHLYIHLSELTENGKVTHAREPLTPEGLAALKERLGEDADVVLEATTSSSSLHDVLKPHARSVVVAHPAQARGASALHVKTDSRDAEILARLLAAGFVRPVWVPPADCRALRGLIEYRCALTSMHTAAMNRVYACFRAELREYPPGLAQNMRQACSMAWGEPHLDLMVRSVVAVKDCLQEQLGIIEAALEKWSNESADARLLRTIPGIGAVVAASILAEIGDVYRFGDATQLCAYAGLVPKVESSGKMLHIGGLAKGGRRRLRWALWIATLQTVRLDGEFQAYYRRLCGRRPKKVALIASAHKLLTVIWHMLRTRQPFRRTPSEAVSASIAKASKDSR